MSKNTTSQRNYRLQVIGNQYALRDGNTDLLSGAVRDYSSFGVPYSLTNYLFLGDNTTSAAANIQLGPIALNSNLSSVPEPCSLMLVLGVVSGIALRRSTRPRTKA